MPRFLTLMAAVGVLTLPLWLDGPSCGHDFDFHLQSWLAAAYDLRHGLFAPHWLPGANYGAGEPRLVFYPPLSWGLGALLGLLAQWGVVPQLLTTVCLLAAGVSFQALARRFVSAPAALLAAVLYVANPYMLFVVYERTAYGELLGAIWMPLLVLATLGLMHEPADVRRRLALLAAAQAALWFSNGPAAVMGAYAVAAMATYAAVRRRSARPAWLAAAGLLLGTALAGVYVVPAAAEHRWVQLSRATEPPMRVQDSFLFAHTSDPLHDQVLHTASVIAVVLLVFALLALVGAAVAKKKPPLAGLAVALAALCLLLVPPSLPLYHLLPELALLQFPWRWLLVVSVVAALGFAVCFHSVAAKPGRWLAPALAFAVCAGAAPWAAHTFTQPCDEEDNVEAQLTLPPPQGTGFEGTDEYTPQGADNGEIQQHLPPVRLLPAPDADEGDDTATPNPEWHPSSAAVEAPSHIERWTPEHIHLVISPQHPTYAVLRLLNYPAWQVEVNGHAVTHLTQREDGLLTIPVPAGQDSIDVRWHTTADVLAGRALSLATAPLLLWASRRRRGSQL